MNKNKDNKFNYSIAHYWKNNSNSVGTYAYGSEVFYGSMESALKMLDFVKKQSPEKDWFIFKLVQWVPDFCDCDTDAKDNCEICDCGESGYWDNQIEKNCENCSDCGSCKS